LFYKTAKQSVGHEVAIPTAINRDAATLCVGFLHTVATPTGPAGRSSAGMPG
jgi:hypothetical protein